MATFHAATVSLASAGLMTMKFGMALSEARCSTGWCVGPSSPTAMLSWVKTKMEWTFIKAATRREGRK